MRFLRHNIVSFVDVQIRNRLAFTNEQAHLPKPPSAGLQVSVPVQPMPAKADDILDQLDGFSQLPVRFNVYPLDSLSVPDIPAAGTVPQTPV